MKLKNGLADTESISNEKRFQIFAENLPDLITIVDTHQELHTFCNRDTIFGYTLDEVKTPIDIMHKMLHKEDRPRVFQHWLTLFNPEADVTTTPWLEYRIYDREGKLHWVQARYTTLSRDETGDPLEIMTSITDITERKQSEITLRHYVSELEALAQLAATLNQAATVDQIIASALPQTALFNTISCSLCLLDQASQELVCRGWYPPAPNLIGLRSRKGEGIIGHVAETGKIYISPHPQKDDRAQIHPLTEPFVAGVKRVISLPLLAQEEKVVGVMSLGLADEKPFSTDEIRLLTTVAAMIGNALQRALLLETLDQQVADKTQALAAANDQLLELDNLKNKFIADVSHELRTPATNISLYTSLLQRSNVAKHEQYLQVLKSESARLNNILNDILDPAYMTLHVRENQLQPTDLNQLVAAIVQEQPTRQKSANLALSFTPATSLPLIKTDPHLISQAITHLLANAFNYTPEGFIQVTTTLSLESQEVGIYVKDSGVGIDPAETAYLFERFYRGHYASQSNIPGAGLGLTITRAIVQAHGGRIEVASEVGQGSTFCIWLPLAKQPAV